MVFEFLELDLKKYMDANPNFNADPRIVKVTGVHVYSACMSH